MHNSTIDHLAALAAQVDDVLDRVLDDEVTARCTDGDLITVLTLVGRLGRRIDALAVEATGAVIDRSRTGDIDARLTTRFGCHDVSELLQRTTLISPQTAGRWQRSARLVHREISITTGEVLPPMFPAMRGALLAGDVGIDGLLAVAGPLSDLDRRVDHSAVRAADTALAAAARGEGPDQSPPACADLLKVHASAWAAALDQDGAEPRERQAVWRRFLTLGRLRDGIVPIRGGLLPEVAAQLQRIMDAVGSPRVAGDTGGVRFVPEGEAPGATVGESAGGDSAASDDLGADRGATNAVGDTDDETLGLGLVPPDERRAGQRRHDALATALFAATASELLPTIGGAAPTLVVATLESDLINDRGVAHIDGSDAPLHIAAARHLACTGVIHTHQPRTRRSNPAPRHRRARLQPPPTPRHRTA